MNIKRFFAGSFFYLAKYWAMVKGQPGMVSFTRFPCLIYVPIISSVEYQFWNIIFCFCLALFVFNLTTILLILLFGTTHNCSYFSSWTPSLVENYGSFGPRLQKKVTWLFWSLCNMVSCWCPITAIKHVLPLTAEIKSHTECHT